MRLFSQLAITILALASMLANGRADEPNTMSLAQTATGSFKTTLTPQDDPDHPAGRLAIDKIYSGDLVGSGKGQMLSHRTATKGSAGYVAIETVTATLDGRSGSFVLQHSGSMNRGQSSLRVSIIPDSGTGELAGISGTMDIDSSAQPHTFVLSYSLANDSSR